MITENKVELTDKEIENYLDHTMTAGEHHIREEIKWLVGCASNDAKDTIKDLAETWAEE